MGAKSGNGKRGTPVGGGCWGGGGRGFRPSAASKSEVKEMQGFFYV